MKLPIMLAKLLACRPRSAFNHDIELHIAREREMLQCVQTIKTKNTSIAIVIIIMSKPKERKRNKRAKIEMMVL